MHSAGLFVFALSALAASASADASQDTPCPTMPPLPGGNSTCNFLVNKDRPGFDLANVKGKLQSCEKACDKTSGCVTWSWNNYEGGTCWLKSRASKLVDKEGVTSTDCINEKESPVCSAFKDIDFAGNDIANKKAEKFKDCCGICNNHPGCKAYAWSDYNGGTCWLKSGVDHVVAKVGVVSSSIVLLDGPVCPFEQNIDFVGNDIGNKPAKHAGECCKICKTNKDCKAYSWSGYNGGTCWMKSGKGKTIASPGVISAKLVGF